MRRNGYLGTSGKIYDTIIRFPDRDSLTECEISPICRRLRYPLSFAKLKVRHISTSGYFICCAKFEVDICEYPLPGWWRGTVVERRSLAGELSLSCARPAADG